MRVVKIHRQHNSAKITIPNEVLAALEVSCGDYIGIDIAAEDHEATLFRIHRRSQKDGDNKIGSYRKNINGGSQAETGGK